MSWDQGVQERDDLPAVFVDWAEKKAVEQGISEPLAYVTWFGSEPNRLICDFGEGGSITLRFKPAGPAGW